MRRKTQTRARVPAVPLKPHERVIKYVKEFKDSEHGEHVAYVFNRLVYLMMVMIMGVFVQFVWNSAMDQFFQGQYHMSLFEAAILWVCIY
jgi:hypothetical protein